MKCELCGKTYKTEKGFQNHRCMYMDRAEMFFEDTIKVWKMICKSLRITISKSPTKQKMAFIKFPMYNDMIIFIAFVNEVKCLNVQEYIDYLVRHRVSIKNWTNPHNYKKFISEFLKNEPTSSAIVRSEEYIKTLDSSLKDISSNRLYLSLIYGNISLKYILYNDYKVLEMLSIKQLEEIQNIYEGMNLNDIQNT